MADFMDEMLKEKKAAPEIKLQFDGAAVSEDLTVQPSLQPDQTTAKQLQEYDESTLTPEEKKMVEDFASQININDTNLVLQYGAGAQKKVADFSDTALDKVRTKDLGEIGEMLTGLMGELRELDDEDKGGFLGLFKKGGNKLSAKKAKYEKAEANVGKISDELEKHEMILMKDSAMLDQLYDVNKTYFKELSMYILAGKKKLAQVRNEELPRLQAKADQSGLPEDAQAVNDTLQLCDRFDKKIHDLELTRMVSLQMAPQIRLVQNNDTIMAEKIQSTIVNTIPLWKSQMVLALGISHSTEAAAAQREVTNMTNTLLQKNAETLKMASIETAKESERGVVEIETLKKTNETLMSTIDEVLKIQKEGREKRRQAEVELRQMEQEIKQKLLEQR